MLLPTECFSIENVASLRKFLPSECSSDKNYPPPPLHILLLQVHIWNTSCVWLCALPFMYLGTDTCFRYEVKCAQFTARSAGGSLRPSLTKGIADSAGALGCRTGPLGNIGWLACTALCLSSRVRDDEFGFNSTDFCSRIFTDSFQIISRIFSYKLARLLRSIFHFIPNF